MKISILKGKGLNLRAKPPLYNFIDYPTPNPRRVSPIVYTKAVI